MTLFLVLLTYFVILVGGVIGVGLLFRWLIKKFTGYDIWYFHGAQHEYLKNEVDFAKLNDWDHETGFVSSNDNRKRKARKAKVSPHYDRLHAMEQSNTIVNTPERLQMPTKTSLDDDSVTLSDLLNESSESSQTQKYS
ncbi:MAG: hypothetical protein AAF846_20690 [Chloroflexota bacterium]